jgi:hypothetical protein
MFVTSLGIIRIGLVDARTVLNCQFILLELLFIRDESFFLTGLDLNPAEISTIISHLCRD